VTSPADRAPSKDLAGIAPDIPRQAAAKGLAVGLA
jgi:hypothetical protein